MFPLHIKQVRYQPVAFDFEGFSRGTRGIWPTFHGSCTPTLCPTRISGSLPNELDVDRQVRADGIPLT